MSTVDLLGIADFHRLAQTHQRIHGRDELVSHVTLVADIEQRFHDRSVVDFLPVVQFTAIFPTPKMMKRTHGHLRRDPFFLMQTVSTT